MVGPRSTVWLERSSLRGDLEELLACRVHVVTTTGLNGVREDVRERIERESVAL
jgi:predicted nucleotidyltransferase